MKMCLEHDLQVHRGFHSASFRQCRTIGVLTQIDVIQLQPLQTGIHGVEDCSSREPSLIHVVLALPHLGSKTYMIEGKRHFLLSVKLLLDGLLTVGGHLAGSTCVP